MIYILMRADFWNNDCEDGGCDEIECVVEYEGEFPLKEFRKLRVNKLTPFSYFTEENDREYRDALEKLGLKILDFKILDSKGRLKVLEND